jgi:predicted O-methyltransferase YrrM
LGDVGKRVVVLPGGLNTRPALIYMPHKDGFVQLLGTLYNTANVLYGIEIGCFRGEFDRYVLSKCPAVRMVTIDPMPIWHSVFENNKQFIEQQRFRILPLTSDEAAAILKGEYDFIFIDGDHSYEQCKKDILNYKKFIKKGGLMSGHNYHKAPASAHPGVHESVDEIFGDRVKLQPDFSWYVQV